MERGRVRGVKKTFPFTPSLSLLSSFLDKFLSKVGTSTPIKMVFLMKLLSSGLGLTSEAIKAARDRSSSGQASTENIDSSTSSSTYVEVADNDTADELVRKGLAERVDDQTHKQQTTKIAEAGYAGVDQDEAVWELDEMAVSVRPPTYQDNMATYEDEPEEVRIKMREALVQNLVAMAGPAPKETRPLPCPVIIPQRRPRKRDRGFARAYAPVLADCGISQDVFLEFLEDLDKVHTVRSIASSPRVRSAINNIHRRQSGLKWYMSLLVS